MGEGRRHGLWIRLGGVGSRIAECGPRLPTPRDLQRGRLTTQQGTPPGQGRKSTKGGIFHHDKGLVSDLPKPELIIDSRDREPRVPDTHGCGHRQEGYRSTPRTCEADYRSSAQAEGNRKRPRKITNTEPANRDPRRTKRNGSTDQHPHPTSNRSTETPRPNMPRYGHDAKAGEKRDG